MIQPLVQRHPLLDELLDAYAVTIGGDLVGYRNHCYRVLNVCAALSTTEPKQLEKIAVAAAFHDLAIWTEATFDYLAPSRDLARAWLHQTGRAAWNDEVEAMILDHHKLRQSRAAAHWLVEPFRRADLVDVSLGIVRAGLPRPWLREVYAAFPSAGFHRRLLQLSLRRLWTHPWSPLPMVRF